MTWKECLEWIKKEQEFLDTINLKPFIKKDKNISDIMEEIEEQYGEQYTLEPFIFNCMNKDEFIDYLKERYNDFYYYEYSELRVLKEIKG